MGCHGTGWDGRSGDMLLGRTVCWLEWAGLGWVGLDFLDVMVW